MRVGRPLAHTPRAYPRRLGNEERPHHDAHGFHHFFFDDEFLRSPASPS
jgi:hypothetical protein